MLNKCKYMISFCVILLLTACSKTIDSADVTDSDISVQTESLDNESTTPKPSTKSEETSDNPPSEDPPELKIEWEGTSYRVVETLTDFTYYSNLEDLEASSEVIAIGSFGEVTINGRDGIVSSFHVSKTIKGAEKYEEIQIAQRTVIDKNAKQIIAYSKVPPMENDKEWICFLADYDKDGIYSYVGDTCGIYPCLILTEEELGQIEEASKTLGRYRLEDFSYRVYGEIVENYHLVNEE